MDFEAALEWHRDQLGTAASKTVTYRRGEFESEISVTLGGRNAPAEYAANTVRVESELQDFIIDPREIVLDGYETLPVAGDTITLTSSRSSSTYRVLPLTENGCFDWDSKYEKLLTVHTKLMCDEDEDD